MLWLRSPSGYTEPPAAEGAGRLITFLPVLSDRDAKGAENGTAYERAQRPADRLGGANPRGRGDRHHHLVLRHSRRAWPRFHRRRGVDLRRAWPVDRDRDG